MICSIDTNLTMIARSTPRRRGLHREPPEHGARFRVIR
jgi:hypothetical protein